MLKRTFDPANRLAHGFAAVLIKVSRYPRNAPRGWRLCLVLLIGVPAHSTQLFLFRVYFQPMFKKTLTGYLSRQGEQNNQSQSSINDRRS
jgi:hypothetical protein